jgi:hypothetical protein
MGKNVRPGMVPDPPVKKDSTVRVLTVTSTVGAAVAASR